MKKVALSCLVFAAVTLCAQSTGAAGKAPAAPAKAAPQTSGKAGAQQSGGGLDEVLTQMDNAAAQFKSAQAEFVWDQYQKVVNETDSQKGTIYFRRNGKATEMAADISEPDKKQVVFNGTTLRLYQPKIDQVTEIDASKNKADFETFLVLGFGGRGHDLAKSFDVAFGGYENVSGARTARLDLVPKAEKARNMFNHISLWIDPARGVSVQQRFQEPSGDYRLAKYTNIKLNQNIAGDAFKLKTTGKTKVVKPQG